jgi:hypothetical protein
MNDELEGRGRGLFKALMHLPGPRERTEILGQYNLCYADHSGRAV